jgi:hypothetical protein
MKNIRDNRPLFSLKIDEIREIFENHPSQKLKEQILNELGHRKTMRARLLLDAVKKAVSIFGRNSDVEAESASPQIIETPNNACSPVYAEQFDPQTLEGAEGRINLLEDKTRADIGLFPENTDKSITINVAFPEDARRQNGSNDFTLIELVTSSDCSVRLTNCISRSHLSDMVAADAFADPINLELECQKITGMGAKSIRELKYILAQKYATAPMKQEASESLQLTFGGLQSTLKKSLAQLFNEITLEQICEIVNVPVRVAKGIEASAFRVTPLGELFLDWPNVYREMTQQRNLGRASVNELARICTDIAVRLLQTALVSDDTAKMAANFLLLQKPISDDLSAELIGTLQGVTKFKISDLAVSEIVPLSEMTEILISELSARPRDVIRRRYGIGRDQAETLEQIGTHYNCTRERIRQIEKKALEVLSVSAKLLPIMDCLVAYGDEAWDGLGGKKGYISQHSIKNVRGLPPEFLFLSDLAGVALEDWLDTYGRRWQGGWCSKSINITELDAIAHSLERDWEGKALPRPSCHQGLHSDIDLTAVAAELKFGKRLYGGYVLEANRETRLVRRVIELHSMFGSEARPIEAAELVQRLSAKLSGPSISIRYVSAIMSRHPHLFLEGDDAEWFGIGAKANSGDASRFEFAPLSSLEEGEGDDAFTMAGFLKSILERTGPMKFTDIVTEAQKTLPSDRSIASVGPTMLMHREIFVRALPGVYGLHQAMPAEGELVLRPPAYLVNEEQARLFALGRRAGEPWGAFRLWTPAAEYSVCSWAKRHARSALFESLLTVASVEEWPATDAEKTDWKRLIDARGGKFNLHFEPKSDVGYVLPKLDRLLAACLEARAFGKFNWIVGNRMLNRQADAHSSAGLVALMNVLGALQFDPSSNWQMPQGRGPRLNEIVGQLEDELHNFGELNWQSPLGSQLLKGARDMGASMGGWINHRLLMAMLDSSALAKKPLNVEVGENDLEELLREFRQANEAKMLGKILDDLAASDHLDR